MEGVELKPCPFCGGTEIMTYDCPSQADDKTLWKMYCLNCHSCGPIKYECIDAKKAWNRGNEVIDIAKNELDRCDKELRATQKLNNDILWKNNKMREHLKHALSFIPTAESIYGTSSPWYQLRETLETALKQG